MRLTLQMPLLGKLQLWCLKTLTDTAHMSQALVTQVCLQNPVAQEKARELEQAIDNRERKATAESAMCRGAAENLMQAVWPGFSEEDRSAAARAAAANLRKRGLRKEAKHFAATWGKPPAE